MYLPYLVPSRTIVLNLRNCWEVSLAVSPNDGNFSLGARGLWYIYATRLATNCSP